MDIAYTWNASPIDGVDILRYVPTIGLAWWFSLNINLVVIPNINNSSNVLLCIFTIPNVTYLSRDICYLTLLKIDV